MNRTRLCWQCLFLFNLVIQFFSELCCKEVGCGFGLLVKAGYLVVNDLLVEILPSVMNSTLLD